MTDLAGRNKSDLVFFTHTIDGKTYGAWYRPMPADCIEILGIGLMQIVSLHGRRAEDLACEVLEEFVRIRKKLGQPVPTLPAEAAIHADFRCPESGRESTSH
jgi:hypothetical protein